MWCKTYVNFYIRVNSLFLKPKFTDSGPTQGHIFLFDLLKSPNLWNILGVYKTNVLHVFETFPITMVMGHVWTRTTQNCWSWAPGLGERLTSNKYYKNNLLIERLKEPTLSWSLQQYHQSVFSICYSYH